MLQRQGDDGALLTGRRRQSEHAAGQDVRVVRASGDAAGVRLRRLAQHADRTGSSRNGAGFDPHDRRDYLPVRVDDYCGYRRGFVYGEFYGKLGLLIVARSLGKKLLLLLLRR